MGIPQSGFAIQANTEKTCRMSRAPGVSLPKAVMKAMKKNTAQMSRKTAIPMRPPRQLEMMVFSFAPRTINTLFY